MSHNGIKHITESPYHTLSNGLAERSIQTFKRAMVKISGGSVRERVSKFLTRYLCTPHSTTGLSPAELMFGRNIRAHIDIIIIIIIIIMKIIYIAPNPLKGSRRLYILIDMSMLQENKQLRRFSLTSML